MVRGRIGTKGLRPFRVGSSSGESCRFAGRAHQMDRDTGRLGQHRAFRAAFPPVYWGSAGVVAATDGFGDRPVDGEVVEVQADHPFIAGQRDLVQAVGQSGLGPLGQASSDGAIRAPRCSDPFVPAAMDQGRDHMLEHDPVRDPSPVHPDRMGRVELRTLGQESGELLSQRVDQRRWENRHGASREDSKS